MSDEAMRPPPRISLIMGTRGVRIWTGDDSLRHCYPDDEVHEYVPATPPSDPGEVRAFGLALLADVSGALREAGMGVMADRLDAVAAQKVDALISTPIAPAGEGWRDIASAPRDGHVLVFSAAYKWRGLGGRAIGYLHADYGGRKDVWTLDGRCGPPAVRGDLPTHWMPLPAPPALTGIHGEAGNG